MKDNMLQIKFSHYYTKLHGQETAELIAVRTLEYPQTIDSRLISYDAGFYDKGVLYFYPMQEGPYIQLIFVGDHNIPFCTLRKDDEEGKLEFYRENIGKKFKIVVGNRRLPKSSACFDCAYTSECKWLINHGPCSSCGSKKLSED